MSATLTSDSLFRQASAVPEAVSLSSRAENANDKSSFFGRLMEAIGRVYCVQTADGERILVIPPGW